MSIYFVSVIGIPISQFHIAAGYVYTSLSGSKWQGLVSATLVAVPGCYLSTLCNFGLGRFCLRKCVKDRLMRYSHKVPFLKKWDLFDEIISDKEEAVKMIVMIRMMMVPLALTNYLISITNISFYAYAIGNIACIIKIPIYCYLGCLLQSILSRNEWRTGDIIVFAGEIVLTISMTVIISLVAKQTIEKKMKERQ